jgi:hypothetical protein
MCGRVSTHEQLRLSSNADVPPGLGLDQLIEGAKKEDADWYKSIIGNDLDDIAIHRDFSPEVARSTGLPDDTTMSSDRSSLLALGYSIDECAMLKKPVVTQVIKNSVKRPLGDIPLVWFEKKYVESSAARPTVPGAKVVPKTHRRKPEPSLTNQDAQIHNNAHLRDNTGTFTTFAWKGTGSKVTDAEFADIDAASPDSTIRGQSKIDAFGEPTSPTFVDDSELSFLPSVEEFRSMLIEESRWHMRSVGSWIAPLLRLENKLRTKLYEGFLYFLDNGVGDVVDKAFALLDGVEREDGDLPPRERGDGEGEGVSSAGEARPAAALPPIRGDDDARSNRLNSMGALKTRAAWVQDGNRDTRLAGGASPRSLLERVEGETACAAPAGEAHHRAVIETDVVEEAEDGR